MSIICRTKWLNPFTYTNSDRAHKIVHVNSLHVLYGILVIEIFELKVVYFYFYFRNSRNIFVFGTFFFTSDIPDTLNVIFFILNRYMSYRKAGNYRNTKTLAALF